ncbi:substrate-binding periplasmic protein [Roseibium sp.]|uniref:substrate-binding periplasmic protein n=1 Tax=Roseibium sp. TaxID=1936156 RepID=UPI003D09929C
MLIMNGGRRTVRGAIGLLGVFCALLTGGAQAQATEIHLVTENYPPFNFMQDGEIVGLGADQVREIMIREKIDFTMEMLPWSRAFWLAENRKNHCVFTTAYTPARAASFAWISPLGGAELFLIKKSGSQIPSNLAEIVGDFSVGTQRSDYAEYVLQKNGFGSIDYFDDVETVIRQLVQERLHLAAISSVTFHTLVQQGVEVELVHGFGDIIGNALACNPETDEALLKRMQNGLDSIIQDGFQAAILKKYTGAASISALTDEN